MAVSSWHHVVDRATASLPWTAAVAAAPANLAALQGGRPARCRDHANAVDPRGGRVPFAGGGRAGSRHRARRALHPRVARWGVLGRVVIRGPHHAKARTRHDEHAGSPEGRVAGSPVVTGPAATCAGTAERAVRAGEAPAHARPRV